MNKDLCTVVGCLFNGKYCRLHPGGKLKNPTKLKPRSDKLEKVMRKEYRPQVKEMVEANTPCNVNSPVCTKVAQGFHHLAGKEGELLTNREKKIPCFNMCNLFIEENHAWARANGFKLSRHANYKRSKI
jgi:hypothetical protein